MGGFHGGSGGWHGPSGGGGWHGTGAVGGWHGSPGWNGWGHPGWNGWGHPGWGWGHPGCCGWGWGGGWGVSVGVNIGWGWGWPSYPYAYGYPYPYYYPYYPYYPYNGPYNYPPPPPPSDPGHDKGNTADPRNNQWQQNSDTSAPELSRDNNVVTIKAPKVPPRSTNYRTVAAVDTAARPEVRNVIRALEAMPPEARRRQIESGRYRNLAPEEQDLLRRVALTSSVVGTR